MLPVLVLFMLVAVPWAQATRLFSVDDQVRFNEHNVLVERPSFSLRSVNDPTVPDDPNDDANQLIGYPDGRGSGNQFFFEDFSQCAVGPVSSQYNDFTFGAVTSGVGFSCLQSGTGVATGDGRTPSSRVLSFDKNAVTGTVTHSITTTVSMFTNGYQASFDFMMYIPTSPIDSTGLYLEAGHVSAVYTIESNPPVDLGAAGELGSGNPLMFTELRAEPGDGEWKRYIVYFTVGSSSNPVNTEDVTITIKFTRNTATRPTMLIDLMYVRYYTLIRNPTGDDLFWQKFDSCSATVGTDPVTTAVALGTPWILNTNDIVCSSVRSATTSPWSLLMADQERLSQSQSLLLDRRISHIIDSALQPGQEVTLEFWVRYEESLTENVNIQDPTIQVAVEVDSGEVGWENTAFSGELLPGARVIEDDVNSDYVENGFYKYRVTYTLPQTQYTGPEIVRFQINIRQLSQNAQTIASGTFYIDDIRMKYTSYRPNSGTVGDPQFVGLYNQNYQVHGIDGGVYNLVSSPTTQVNSRFVFLSEGKCPIFDGIPARNCFAHPGSYLGSIGIQEIVDGVNHKVTIVSGPAKAGFASVEIDGMKLSVNDSVAHGTTFDVNFVTSHIVMVNTADFAFTFENSDMFINQGVAAHRRLSELTSHGLFGQTHKRVVYPSKLKYIEGEVDDYLIAEDDLFGHDFVYNQFHL